MSEESRADRIIGVLLGGAVGDALGVPYEYGARRLVGEPAMVGGGLGGYAPAQWSDDTEMATVIARVAATGADLRDDEALDAIADGFIAWCSGGPADIGTQTQAVLNDQRPGAGSAARLRTRAEQLHTRTGRSAGNGSLMRTGPVALAHRGDPAAIVEAAAAVSALTHHDPDAGVACALWCLAIDHAVATGTADPTAALHHLRDDDSRLWIPRIEESAQRSPEVYAATNGWVVAALQGAWAAICSAPDDAQAGLVAAVRGGGDTDTVAAIAGSLLGAAHGASALRPAWRHGVHGWPGLDARGLATLAVTIDEGRAAHPA